MRAPLALLMGLALLGPAATAAAQAPAGPVIVVPVASPDVDPGVVEPIATRVTDTLSERVKGREVRRVSDASRMEAIATCTGPDCLATEMRAERAALAVLVHVTAAAPEGAEGEGQDSSEDEAGGERAAADDPEAGDTTAATPLTVGLRAVNVTGTPQGTPLEVRLAGADESALGGLDGPVSQLATMLPAPPPESSLLLAINVDGAEVVVDGEKVGTSPLAPLELEPGEHMIRVAKASFGDFQQTVTVKVGEAARLDVDLEPDAAARARLEAEDEARPTATTPVWERWYLWAAIGGVVLITVVGGAVAAAAGGGNDGGGGGGEGFPVPEIVEAP